MDESDLRPSWRLIDTPNNKKSQTGRSPRKRMLIYDERSRYRYENKQNNDIKSGQMSDIYGKVTRILQQIADFQGQFALSCVFRCVMGGVKSCSTHTAAARGSLPYVG